VEGGTAYPQKLRRLREVAVDLRGDAQDGAAFRILPHLLEAHRRQGFRGDGEAGIRGGDPLALGHDEGLFDPGFPARARFPASGGR
jgi:hypothetical protein